jgi:hypothetical protein
MSGDTWYAWFAIGAAASLGAMIWSFRRGVLGVVANFAAGVGGAFLGGALAKSTYPQPFLRGPAIPGIPAAAGPPHLVFAGLGAILALLVLHVAWAGLLVWRGRQAPAR